MTRLGILFMGLALLATPGVVSAVAAQEGTTWREEAQKCYDHVSQGGNVTYQGRSGIDACDRFVSQAREDEARRTEILKSVIPELLRQNAQQQRDAQERFEKSLRPPPEPTRCQSYMIGRTLNTDCNK